MTDSDPPAPETVFFSITMECPMHCKVCSMWDLTDPPDSLTPDERLAVIDQLKGFGRPVHVVVTGGEPFTKMSELFGMATRLRSQGNSMSVVTSGIMLTDPVVERLVGAGIDHLAVSIDFATPEQHDAQRGRSGTFQRATRAIAKLVQMRNEGLDVPTVGINSVVMAQNLNYLDEIVRLSGELGAEELLFQPIQPDFGLADSVSMTSFRNWLPMDPTRVDAAVERLVRSTEIVPVRQTESEFATLRRYFRNPLAMPPGTCQSAARNLMVDVSGWVTHCFGQARTGLPPLGRVPKDDLVSIWNSEAARKGRTLLATCTFGCGTLLCHSRSSVPTTVRKRWNSSVRAENLQLKAR